jgi:outer membrane lipoprotein-sorting protein
VLLTCLAVTLVAQTPTGAPVSPPTSRVLTENELKARKVLEQVIEALGGKAYQTWNDQTCTGTFAQFGHSGEVTGFIKFWDYIKQPDKERTEFGKKRNLLTVYNGQQGWDLDRGGVTEMSAERIKRFHEDIAKDYNTILRAGLDQEGLRMDYEGTDIVDNRLSETVEITTATRFVLRMAVEQATHLPLRVSYFDRDEETRERVEIVITLANYQNVDGIQTPYYVSRTQNGLKRYEARYTTSDGPACRYNSGLPDELFTRASLEQRWKEIGKK